MGNSKPASLKDIAAKLGVSIATVSRALQGNPAISEKTRLLVEDTAQKLHYSKNYIADSLRSGSLPVIGVIVPHGVTIFYSSVLDGIEQTAAGEGYAVVSMNSHESYEEERYNLRSLAGLHVAGIIASVAQETADFSHFDALAADNIPVVFVAREPHAGTDYPAVVADSVEASYKAASHLIDRGCRRIAILCGPGRLKMVAERKHGYIEALHDHRLPVRPEYVEYCDINTESAIAATRRLLNLPERPDAIIALNDTLLFAAMKAIKRHGLAMPDDVALIGFSDVEYVEDVSPTLSTVEDQSHLMGETACRTLIGLIRGDSDTKKTVVPTTIHIRESSNRRPQAEIRP